MDPLSANPFAVLTFIAAPAILTNASSVMALGTSNRFARVIDRIRALAAELSARHDFPQDVVASKVRQLTYVNRRARYLVRALTTFYLSLGAFAAASFASLIGAVFVIAHQDVPRDAAMLVAFVCGATGVGGLVAGSLILVRETRLTLAYLREETDLLAKDIYIPQPEEDRK
ncbi:DUF2721 domain-containing protein [Fimbriiglobus ruber]|uniref:DUF2721 domain-containing protein n=1 Tax=Fimbriiglobus ruber TaxID=1908690 RepID=A0A225DPM3_9BACT|nr:DUF2721 domain-containing protein [Fimbriiglobus ruber]OWK43251.1 hypothetical protein FRUB_02850 [Fimbriiglobus ruber]